jgi:hypothetical protein
MTMPEAPAAGTETVPGARAVMTGAENSNASAVVVPPGPVVTATAPAVWAPAGAMPGTQVTCWELVHECALHKIPARDILDSSLAVMPKWSPEISTTTPCSARPAVAGATVITTGGSAKTRNAASVLVPWTVDIDTVAGPTGCGSVTTTTVAEETHEEMVVLVPSMNTPVTSAAEAPKNDPVSVKSAPPVVGTLAGAADTRSGAREGVTTAVPADSGPAPSELLSDKVYVYAVFSSRGPGSTNVSVGAGTVARSTPPRYTEYTVTGRFPLVAFKGTGQEIVKVPVVGKLERDTAGAGGASGTVNGCGESVIVIKVEFWISAM